MERRHKYVLSQLFCCCFLFNFQWNCGWICSNLLFFSPFKNQLCWRALLTETDRYWMQDAAYYLQVKQLNQILKKTYFWGYRGFSNQEWFHRCMLVVLHDKTWIILLCPSLTVLICFYSLTSINIFHHSLHWINEHWPSCSILRKTTGRSLGK